jgi:asparagine synthase (glutamine-hydrolysing)
VKPDIARLLPEVLWHFDQPFANPTAVVLYMLSGEARRYVKVVLAGTGGDEMFAGYPRYLGMLFYQQYRHLPAFLRQGAATLACRLLRDSTDGYPGPQRVRRFLEGGAMPFDACYLRLLVALDDKWKRALYTGELKHELLDLDTADFIHPYLSSSCDLPELERLMLADIHSYLPYNQLTYGDRMSMAQSLEVRVPFVDQRLVEVAGGIPLRWKMSGGKTKGLFRRAMAPFLPSEIVQAPKRGLNLPIALWFRRDLRDWVRSLLSPERLRRRGYFRPEAVVSLLEEHETGRRDHSLLIWALVVLEVWQQMYVDNDGFVSLNDRATWECQISKFK